MLPVVADKEGLHDNVKFVVSLAVSAYVGNNVSPQTLSKKLLLLLRLMNSN